MDLIFFSPLSAEGYSHQLVQAETPQDPPPRPRGSCKAVVSGLLSGTRAQWEVEFDVEPYLNGREREEKVHEELWNENFHYLAGRSIIHDFEHMADRECEIEHGGFVGFSDNLSPCSGHSCQFKSGFSVIQAQY